MTSLSARRMAMCIASTAMVAVAAMPAAASATPERLEQCAGESINGLGSTFQDPVQKIWTGEIAGKGFNTNTKEAACQGKEIAGKKTKGKPKVVYHNATSAEQGSGKCLAALGVGSTEVKKPSEYDFCGTDEAPNPTQKKEIEEENGTYTNTTEENLETIPVLQGAVAVIVHLPGTCTAEAEPTSLTKVKRLVLDDATIEGIYSGTITKWSEVISHQGVGHGNDKLNSCTAAQEAMTIKPVVRLDKSGTTHIFKEFLAQVTTTPFQAEEFGNIDESATKNHVFPCGGTTDKPEEAKTWTQVGEGCENQRWPTAAHVLRPSEGNTGNGGVIATVGSEESSIGYADLAVAREKELFSSASQHGGEGESKFWVEVQNSKEKHGKVTYADPASNGDVATPENSNCKKTVYIEGVGHKIPAELDAGNVVPGQGRLRKQDVPDLRRDV